MAAPYSGVAFDAKQGRSLGKGADGDAHILFRVDREFESLLNEKNIAREHRDLVLEPICQRSPT